MQEVMFVTHSSCSIRTDGLASSIVRQANNDTTEDRKWVLFDGPIDSVWIENMNTVCAPAVLMMWFGRSGVPNYALEIGSAIAVCTVLCW